MNSMKNIFLRLLIVFLLSFSTACTRNQLIEENQKKLNENQQELQLILKTQELNEKQRYSIINQMANNLLATKDYQGVILFLTDWVENNPDDMYNSYWLLMTAYAYLSIGAEPVIAGCAAAFASGYIALSWLMRLIKKGRLEWFACYLIPVGILGMSCRH